MVISWKKFIWQNVISIDLKGITSLSLSNAVSYSFSRFPPKLYYSKINKWAAHCMKLALVTNKIHMKIIDAVQER